MAFTWSGYTWNPREQGSSNPGPNLWSAANATVNGAGQLVLTVNQQTGNWYCVEVVGPHLGYGRYSWQIASPVHDFDRHLVLSLFTYDETAGPFFREIDLEIAQFSAAASERGWMTLQPGGTNKWGWFNPSTTQPSTFGFTWAAGKIRWEVRDATGRVVETFLCTTDVPTPGTSALVRMNLWLFGGTAPTDGQPRSVTFDSFTFTAAAAVADRAPTSHLVDTFPYGSFSSLGQPTAKGRFTNTFGATAPAIVDGRARLTLTAGAAAYTGIGSGPQSDPTRAFDLTASEVLLEWVTLPSVGNGTTEAVLECRVDPDTNQNVVKIGKSGTQLVTSWVSGGTPNATFTAYDDTLMRWWRIREAAGTLYWETSPNGNAWATLRAVATPITVTAVFPYVIAGHYDTEPTPGIAEFDNFNNFNVPSGDTSRYGNVYGNVYGASDPGFTNVNAQNALAIGAAAVGLSVTVSGNTNVNANPALTNAVANAALITSTGAGTFAQTATATAIASNATVSTNVISGSSGGGSTMLPLIQVAFAAQPMDVAPVWTDITDHVLLDSPLQIVRGRTDEFSRVQPGTLSMTVNNSDGRFTRGLVTSPYYPNVRNGRRVRVSYVYTPKNLVTNPSFEPGLTGWSPGGSVLPTLTQSSTHVHDGAQAMLITWGAGGTFPQAATTITGLNIGSTYTASGWAWVSSGDPAVKFAISGGPVGSPTTTTGAFQQFTLMFIATAPSHSLQIWPNTTPASGDTVWIDEVQVELGSSVTTFSSTGAVLYPRFDGHVNNWPIAWQQATYAPVNITATDRFKRFGQLGELRSALEEEILRDASGVVEEAQPTLNYAQYGGPSSSGCTNSIVTIVSGGSIHDMGGASAATPNGTNPAVPAGTYTYWNDLPGDWKSCRWTVRPDVDTQTAGAGYYWAGQGYLNETNGSAGSTWYAGLQSKGNLSGNPKILNFAIWGAVAAVVGDLPGTVAQPFSGEGVGYQVMAPYTWIASQSYEISFEVDSTRGARWFALYITNKTTGVKNWHGSIQASTINASIVRGVAYQFSELFLQATPATTCPLLPRATTFFSVPTFTALTTGSGLASVYYPLSEPTGSLSASSITKHKQTPLVPITVGAGQFVQGRDGAIEFGAGTGPGTDELSAPMFAPRATTNGKYLRADLELAIGGGGVTIECWFRVSGLGIVPDESIINRTILVISGKEGSLDNHTTFQIDAAGKLHGRKYRGGVLTYQIVTNGVKNDGETHHAVLTETLAGSTVTARMYVDGVQVSGTPTYTETGSLPTYTRISVGGNTWASDLFTGTIAHVAAYSGSMSFARITDHYKAGKDGLSAERTDVRIGRIATWVGIPSADRSFDIGDSTVGWQSTSGSQPINAMQDVEETENGVLFMSMDGRLIFHKRSRRFNVTPFVTLNAAFAEQIGMSLEIPGDDFGLINDATATRPRNSDVRAVNQASIDEFGLYRLSTTILDDSDTRAQSVVDWIVNIYGEELDRVPNVTVDLYVLGRSNPTLANNVLATEISHMLRFNNLPIQAPSTVFDSFIEGWSETIGTAEWAIVFNCSPAFMSNVWQLGIPGFSELGTTTKLAF